MAAKWLTRIAQYMQRFAEASPIPVGAGIDPDEQNYRRLTGHAHRDLTPVTHERMLQIAHYLYQTNPLAGWLLRTTRNFVVGEGIMIGSEDAEINEALDALWHDPINRFPLKLPHKVLELGLFGEQCWPVVFHPVTSLMRLANVDPSVILRVEHDPDNGEEPIGVVLRGPDGSDGKKLRIIKGGEDEDLFASAALRLRQEQYIDGDCFYYKVNATSHETRGISDLFSSADWIDGYEQMIMNTLDRTGFINAFCWDVTMEGASDEQIREFIKRNPPPKPGSVNVHNEKVKWEAMAPDLQSEDSEKHARLFRNHILGSQSLPEMWYGGGGATNLATAKTMDVPTFKALQERQLLVKYILCDVIEAQLRHLGLGGYGAELRDAYRITLPRMDVGDVAQASASLVQVASAAAVAEDRGWVAPEEAARLFASAAALVGVDLALTSSEEMQERQLVTKDFEDTDGDESEDAI